MPQLMNVSRLLVAASLLALSVPAHGAATAPAGRTLFADAIVSGTSATGGRYPVTRTTLTSAELAAPLDVVVSLRMRNFAELESRIGSGQTIGRAEMEAKYLPLPADFARVSAWLKAAGFTVTLADGNHTNIFARASVASASAAFAASFARVSTPAGEMTSAVSAPSLPASVGGAVLTILGLQPALVGATGLAEAPKVEAADLDGRIAPGDVLAAYNAPTNFDGTGQTVAVIHGAVPASSDLTMYWQAVGVPESLTNFSVVDVAGGPSTSSQSTYLTDVTIDVEWISSIAPGAKVTLYAVSDMSIPGLMAACTQIMTDGTASVAMCTVGYTEGYYTLSQVQSSSQVFAQMAAAGITMLTGSGNGGSNPPPSGSGGTVYSPSNPLQVVYPASDPNVTAVGGTTLAVDVDWNAQSEVAWSQIATANPIATGGGLSKFFPRPFWQVGAGVPAGTMRCVPDVSMMAATNPAAANSFTGGLTILNGQEEGFIGTTLSTSIWAGFAAIMNQYRKSANLPNFGLISRLVYPLIETDAVFDSVNGNNGAYAAGPGYDFCTGIGSPSLTTFMQDASETVSGLTTPPNPVDPGTPVALATISQDPNATYQWSLNGVPIAGATGAIYRMGSVSAANAGAYSVAITTAAFFTQNYSVGTLSVNSGTPATTARLANISTRAQVGTGANLLIPGFVLVGSGEDTLLIRAVGPGLQQFSVSGVLTQPSLSIFDSNGNVIASNQGWGNAPFPAEIALMSSAVGAFALSPGSADCAILVQLPAGAYTAQVSGVNSGTGVALAEIYEVSSTGTRLVNISTRAQVGTGSNILIPGFYISGSGTEKLLVRGDGPGLTQFSVSGALTNPTISVYSGQTVVASNTGWTTGPDASDIASISASAGAFAFQAGSADSATVVNLGAGPYTVQLSGVGGTTGVGLAELYEVQ